MKKYIGYFLILNMIFYSGCFTIGGKEINESIDKYNAYYPIFENDRVRIDNIYIVTDVFILQRDGSDSLFFNYPENNIIDSTFCSVVDSALNSKGYNGIIKLKPVKALTVPRNKMYSVMWKKEESKVPIEKLSKKYPPFDNESQIASNYEITNALNKYFNLYADQEPQKSLTPRDTGKMKAVFLISSRGVNINSTNAVGKAIAIGALTAILTMGMFVGTVIDRSVSQTTIMLISIPEGRRIWSASFGGAESVSSENASKIIKELINKLPGISESYVPTKEQMKKNKKQTTR